AAIKHTTTISTVDVMIVMTSHEDSTTDLIATATPTLTTTTLAVVAPIDASHHHRSLSIPKNRGYRAEVLKSADAQAVAKVSEVGAQALLEVSKVVDMIAQEVVDEQATVNGDITAGDDNAAAPLDAVDPKQ
ncbi:unnamed protein product, partial [Aphanomyces euteiches]